jgi:hypothetical protein
LGGSFLEALDDYIRNVVGTTLRDGVAKSKDVKDEISDDGVVVHPRRALDDLVREFMAFPIETVAGLIGQPAAEPSPTPPGSKTPPIAPPEEGEEPVPDPSVPWPYGTPLPY